ncbi:MAG TPA: adenylosuccinate lyase [Candidatus Bathyarchaeota archaeon]|mgnify:CR=1 FL=1|nr:adenylosuccinate lyase [Candidatus Bathyarchaeota archaeon]
MPVLPIDTGRYGRPEMVRIFEEESRLRKMLLVEAALARAHAELGNIPREDAERIWQVATSGAVKIERVKEIEAEIKHETMAVVRALIEACGPSGRYVHLGATSSDILDTALALQLKEALTVLKGRLAQLIALVARMAEEHEGTIMVGRTHGQHALPITLGFKLAVWAAELYRHLRRLEECEERVLVGKMSGAVGTMAGLGPRALELQERVMAILGLRAAEISTQIVQRDRLAELICLLALLASTLDNMATEIRELQRTEIGELAEPFDERAQVGSSTMPHKRNPITCERICGLAKVVRGLVVPALENVPTWHERDLTQSSAERFTVPEALILVDYMLYLMIKVLSGLEIKPERMRENLALTKGLIMSEALMLELVRRGMARDEAYGLVRSLALRAMKEDRPFRDVVLEEEAVKALMAPEELEELLRPENYLGTATEQVRRIAGLVSAHPLVARYVEG